MSTPWTQERVARLQSLCAAGKTAKQIAEVFGDCSRNSVIGAIHRNGLQLLTPAPRLGVSFDHVLKVGVWTDERVATLRKMVRQGEGDAAIAEAVGLSVDAARRKRQKMGLRLRASGYRRFVIPRPRLVVNNDAPLPDCKPVFLLDLTRDACRFPVGSATGADQLFCAGPKLEHSSYCAFHRLQTIDVAATSKARGHG